MHAPLVAARRLLRRPELQHQRLARVSRDGHAPGREALPDAIEERGQARGLALLVAASAMLGAFGATAASSACPNGFRYCFVADQPARASELNYNFSQAKEWIEAKVGAVANGSASTAGVISSSVTTGNLTVNNPGTLGFGSSTRQMINLWSTEYGVGVQGGTEYFRSGANFAWFRGGAHNDAAFNAGGGAVAMTLDGSSNLAVSGDISAPSNAWGAQSVTATGYTTATSFNYPNSLNLTSCSSGHFVCGLYTGHSSGDQRYWTGARLALKCCAL